MASLGHIAVGMAAARLHHQAGKPRWRSMAIWSALSMLPDADVIGFGLGVAYGDAWGHRGATHSFAFSILLGTMVGLAAGRFRHSGLRTGIIASLVLGSHATLDTFTDGGLGCALFWPFDLTRYFAPWNPIPVSPIGLDYLSPYGLMVSLVELVLFSPLLFFAFRPARGRLASRRLAGPFLVVWSAAAWLLTSHDPVREAIVGRALGEQTEYASGFSERALRGVRRGEAERAVREALGPPLAEEWFYGFDETQPCLTVGFVKDLVVSARDPEACLELGVDTGTARASVQATLGVPMHACWHYTTAPAHAYFRERRVCFENGKVLGVFRSWTSR
jgi:inner membrane protein